MKEENKIDNSRSLKEFVSLFVINFE
jgi:hypothetical protein